MLLVTGDSTLARVGFFIGRCEAEFLRHLSRVCIREMAIHLADKNATIPMAGPLGDGHVNAK